MGASHSRGLVKTCRLDGFWDYEWSLSPLSPFSLSPIPSPSHISLPPMPSLMAISSSPHHRHKSARTKWRSTKVMNVHDLARDDDFLSHLLVEKLGTGDIPLLVHKMDPARRLPKTNPEDLMAITRRVRPSSLLSRRLCPPRVP